MKMVGRVATNNTGDEGPGAKEATGKGCQLIGRRGVSLVGGGDEFVGRIFGIVGG